MKEAETVHSGSCAAALLSGWFGSGALYDGRPGGLTPIRTSSSMTPQQKKRLSDARDRRNTYGENDKASRRLIPLAKALDIRSERRTQEQRLAHALQTQAQTPDQLDAIENEVRATRPRTFRKSPDSPLGEVLARKARWRREKQGEVQPKNQ